MNAPLYDPKDVAISFKKKPKKGQEYYYVTEKITTGSHYWKNDAIDNDLFDTGNFFLKKSDAQHAADAIKEFLKDGTWNNRVESIKIPEEVAFNKHYPVEPEEDEECSGSSEWTTYTEEEKTALYRMMIEDKLDWMTVLLVLGVVCTGGLLIIALWSII